MKVNENPLVNPLTWEIKDEWVGGGGGVWHLYIPHIGALWLNYEAGGHVTTCEMGYR